MRKAKVLLDENVKLTDEQRKLLENTFESYVCVNVPVLAPVSGLSRFIEFVSKEDECDIVFAAYNPYLMIQLTKESGRQFGKAYADSFKVERLPFDVYAFYFDPGTNRWVLVR